MNEHQLKLAEEALRESEERFRGTFENAAVGIVHNDSAGRFLRVNEKFCAIVGYSREELLQKTLQDIIHPEDLAAHVELYESCFAQGEAPAFGMERRYLRKDGSTVWVEVFASFQRDPSGRPAYAIGVVQDISERKRLEGELRQTNALLQGFADGTQDAVFVKDREGRYLMFNAAASRLVGKPIAEVLGRDDTAIADADGAREVMAHDRHVMESGTAATFEHEFTAAGVTRTYLSSKAPYRDSRGNVIGLIGLCHDITERKRTEEALRQAKERLDLAMHGSNISIWECDMPDGRIENSRLTFINVWELLGYDAPTSTTDFPSTFALLFHPDDQERVQRELQELLASDGQEYESEYRVRTKDGSTRWHLARGTVLRDPKGTPVRFIGTSADITDLKRAEEALRASEQRFRVFVDHAADAFFLTDERGRVLDVNRRACESLGYTRDDLIGMPAFDFVPDLNPTVVEDRIRHLLAGETAAFEDRHRRKDGTVFPVEVRAKAFQEGPRRFLVGLARDVTDRKRAEEALRLSEQRYRSLIEATVAIVWILPASGVADKSEQPSWSAFTGQTSDQIAGWGWLDSIHPDDRDHTFRIWTSAVAAGAVYQIEYRVRRRDGAYRNMLTRGVPILATDGSIREWFGTCTDISDLRKAEQALRESEERFRGTFENAAIGIGHRHLNGRFLRVNQKFCNILGYPRDELLQKTGPGITHPDDLDAGEDLAESLLRGESAGFTLEKRYVRRDGSPVWVELSVSLQRDGAGKPDYFIGIVQDISNRKQLEGELRQAKEVAEAANRAKDEFLANVSHEIRTPMNAILGMTELVLDTPLDEGQRQGLKTVKSAADSLLGIINDLLDFSKIEAGKLELVAADFSLRAAIGDTLRALAVRAHKKGLELIYQVQPDVPDALIGDAGRLRQVLLNLVGNAVKFTDDGEVVARVEIQHEGPRSSPGPQEISLRFTVRDTGIGISPDQQERIFSAFEQEDTSTTRKYGGTGLGLTIAARLVALMGGTITVDSAPSRGSTFAFTARFGAQPQAIGPVPVQPPDSSDARLHHLPVLVVDDNATNRHILAEWLRGWQMEPTAVGDAVAAMDALWHRKANGRPYALVLLDARMPDADGLTVAAKMRERAELAATRIILLTSGERPSDPARFRGLRIDAQLLKPVQQDELLETIYRVMTRSQGNAATSAAPVSHQQADTADVPAATRLHVIVAEDNELSAQVLEQSLVRQGHRVRLASNGREVLALVERGGFDLLLLDVHMPELDGFQVVQAIREREMIAGGHLPIIALTARSRKEDRERCLAAGMDDFQTKPIRPAELLAAIGRVLDTHSSADRRRRDLLDAPVLLAACGGDSALLEKMCQTLTARVPEHLASLREALRDLDAPRLREAAHKCCGLLSEFSTVAGDLAGNLEDLAAGTGLDEAAPVLEQLETIAHELVKQIDGITVEALRRQAEGTDEQSGPAGR